MRVPSDAAVRAQAIDTAGSYIVQAPAGSGKTELLAQRYLALLATVEHPESIVAITFTRKAAAEMRHRIASALERAHNEPEPDESHRKTTWRLAANALAHDAANNWNLLENPGRLRILTMDALCVQLATQLPWTSRLGAAPQMVDDPTSLCSEAALRTLARLESGGEIAGPLEHLLLHLNNNHSRTAELLAGMLAKRDQWMRHLFPQPDREHLEEGLRSLVGGYLHMLVRRTSPQAWEFLRISEMATVPETQDLADPDSMPVWSALAELLLTKGGEIRKSVNKNQGFPPGHARKDDLVDFLKSLDPGFADALDGVRALPAPAYNDAQWHLIESLSAVLLHAAAELKLLFAEQRQIDFAEATQRALLALGPDDDPTPLAFALDFRIQHLLIDEFQDTSVSHRDLLERLTGEWMEGDGRTLFAVGDPMQSIYGFREAEVGLFLDAKAEGIGRLRLTPLVLEANFRSSAEMVGWFNEALQHALAPEEDRETGAIPYSPSAPARLEANVEPVSLHRIPQDEREAEAVRVAELAQQAQGSVAILVRTRKDAAAIVEELNRRGIRFQAVDMDPLPERSAVQDLHALTRALLHPVDATAMLSVLRAPWCGLTLADLLAYAEDRELSPAGAARAFQVNELLSEARAGRGRKPMRASVESLWLALGGPATLRNEANFAEAQAYLELLETLPDASGLDAALGKLFAPPDPSPGPAVQIMTMHKAKGVEFDTVILPGLGRPQRSANQPLLRWWERARGPHGSLLIGTIRPTGGDADTIYSFLGTMETRRQRNESGRLLYVAATRARTRLHLLGWLNDNQDVPYANSMLASLWPAIQNEFLALQAVAAPARRAVKGTTVSRLAAGWRPPDPPPPLAWEAAEPIPGEEITFDWSGESLRLVGTLVHRILQQMARQGRAAWPPSRLASMGPQLEASLHAMGVPSGELAEAAARAKLALESSLTSERGRWVLAEHPEAVSEWELSGVLDGHIRHAKIDRSFIDEQGVRWIIDYKTSSHAGGGVEVFLDNERERYRGQLERYARIVAALDARPIRMGLYFPLLDAWREWPYDPTAAQPAGSGSGRSEG